MTIEEFNKKYENLNIDYPDFFNASRINRIELLKDDDIKKIMTEYENLTCHYQKQIEFIVQVTNDLLKLQPVWEIEPTRECYRLEEEGEK
ncbi:hypothetical protein [Spiroplasma endosymbiont of Nebria brevicollis]|uniref:hypothetical protein n=1 Tax=Spiroplasma endosymbiont of Nebria brevicollis TaxID=3066284 RepID=UPI00313F3615